MEDSAHVGGGGQARQVCEVVAGENDIYITLSRGGRLPRRRLEGLKCAAEESERVGVEGIFFFLGGWERVDEVGQVAICLRAWTEERLVRRAPPPPKTPQARRRDEALSGGPPFPPVGGSDAKSTRPYQLNADSPRATNIAEEGKSRSARPLIQLRT